MGILDITKVARNEFITDVVDSIQKEIGNANIDINAIESNLMIISNEQECTEWEKWFELSYEPTWTLEDRRNRLIYTFNSKGFFTKKFLIDQANIFTNGQIEVEEKFEEWHFVVRFTSIIGIPPNLENFKKMVEVNKPAHLTWEIKFRYRVHKELQPFTHEQLANYTHTELSESSIII